MTRTSRERRRNFRVGFLLLLGLCLAVGGAWRQGWLPLELADAETGKLASESETTAPDENGPAPLQPQVDEIPAFLSDAQHEPPLTPVPPPEERPFPSDNFIRQTADTRPADSSSTDVPPRVGGSPDTAIQTAAPPARPNSADTPTPSSVPSDLQEIDGLIAAGQVLSAHRRLSQIYWNTIEHRAAIQDRIELSARSIFVDPQPHYLEPYEVQPGDQLRLIARRYDVPWQYLARLNRVDPQKIRPGQKLKVIKGPFSAVIDLHRFELTIHAQGYFVRQYHCGIGKDNSSPVGRFRVKEKLENPTYYGPDGVIAADHPENPLGERWIGIGDSYGIHGTIDPESIGKAESRGCIRLKPADVNEVYDLLTVGSEVIIRR